MKVWRLLPRDDDRSKNWLRSHYDGNHGAVIVRAGTTFEARRLAAEFFDRRQSPHASLENPWMHEADTLVEEIADSGFSPEGEAGVLQPTPALVNGHRR